MRQSFATISVFLKNNMKVLCTVVVVKSLIKIFLEQRSELATADLIVRTKRARSRKALPNSLARLETEVLSIVVKCRYFFTFR